MGTPGDRHIEKPASAVLAPSSRWGVDGNLRQSAWRAHARRLLDGILSGLGSEFHNNFQLAQLSQRHQRPGIDECVHRSSSSTMLLDQRGCIPAA